MNNKEFYIGWAIVIGLMIVSFAIGVWVGNDPSLDELEERVEALQLQAYEVNQSCIDELMQTRRLLQREANINIAPNTNGV